MKPPVNSVLRGAVEPSSLEIHLFPLTQQTSIRSQLLPVTWALQDPATFPMLQTNNQLVFVCYFNVPSAFRFGPWQATSYLDCNPFPPKKGNHLILKNSSKATSLSMLQNEAAPAVRLRKISNC